MKAFFDLPAPRVFAHRGLAQEAPENTLLAFAHALSAGARYIETDVHASSDGVAILSHDPDLSRVAGRQVAVGALSAAELAEVDLGDGQVYPTLYEALDGFPDAMFNLDVKDRRAVEPTIRAVERAGAIDRVLVTSFDERRRAATVAGLPGVATSASSRRVALALAAAEVRAVAGVRRALAGIDCVQIPVKAGGLSMATHRFIDTMHEAGLEVHYWTIDEPEEMAFLLARGADGIVSNRVDLAVSQVSRYIIPDSPT